MLIPLDSLVRNYKLKLQHIIHVGANTGEELAAYAAAGAVRILWVEPRRDALAELQENCKRYPQIQHTFSNVAAGTRTGFRELYLANNGQSSSLLKPKTHLEEHPSVTFEKSCNVQVSTLNHIAETAGMRDVQIDLLNLDTQGTELDILRSGNFCLPQVQSIYTEVNVRELYEGCDTLWDLSAFLSAFGFAQLDTSITPYGWGDAFFTRVPA